MQTSAKPTIIIPSNIAQLHYIHSHLQGYMVRVLCACVQIQHIIISFVNTWKYIWQVKNGEYNFRKLGKRSSYTMSFDHVQGTQHESRT
jgi:hypothetical protein